jgi:hypothetical protein
MRLKGGGGLIALALRMGVGIRLGLIRMDIMGMDTATGVPVKVQETGL